jgi:hypothetical protein
MIPKEHLPFRMFLIKLVLVLKTIAKSIVKDNSLRMSWKNFEKLL